MSTTAALPGTRPVTTADAEDEAARQTPDRPAAQPGGGARPGTQGLPGRAGLAALASLVINFGAPPQGTDPFQAGRSHRPA